MSKPTFFADNWDRFGGRASAIFSCYVMSQRLDCNFSFFWPDDPRVPGMEDQVNFFSPEFLQAHRVFQQPSPRDCVTVNVGQFTLNQAKDFVEDFESEVFLKFSDFFALPQFLDDTKEEALSHYSRIALSSMNSELRTLFKDISDQKKNVITVHGRFGDLLNGDFCQYVPINKYIDTISFRVLLDNFTNSSENLEFFSDTPAVVTGLEKHSGLKLQYASDFLDAAQDKTNFAEQWFDLFSIASSAHIFAAPSSAFSTFAAKLGGKQTSEVRSKLLESPIQRALALDYKSHYAAFDDSIRHALEARDISNLLQIHWMHLDFSNVRALAKRSYLADRNYVFASCVWAVIKYLEGFTGQALNILKNAESQAQKVRDTHHDPLAVVLLTKYCLAAYSDDDSQKSILSKLQDLVPLQFYFAPFLTSWESRIGNSLLKEHHSSRRSLRTLFGRRKLFVADLWGVVQKLNSNRSLYLLPWNEVLETNQNEFLYSILEMLMAEKLRGQYSHHSRP